MTDFSLIKIDTPITFHARRRFLEIVVGVKFGVIKEKLRKLNHEANDRAIISYFCSVNSRRVSEIDNMITSVPGISAALASGAGVVRWDGHRYDIRHARLVTVRHDYAVSRVVSAAAQRSEVLRLARIARINGQSGAEA